MVQNGFYSDGPTIYKYNPLDSSDEIEILTTIGNKLNIVGNNKSQYDFKEQLDLSTNFFYRHYNQNEAINYDEIKNLVEADGLKLISIYHVMLDLYGDIVVDFLCEVA